MRPERFFVGVDVHMIGIPVPIMISDLRARRVKRRLRRAADSVMIDSGSFTIHDRGQEFDPPEVYVDRIHKYMGDVGNVVAVSTYGRMCEPDILAKTGSSIDRNQKLTIESFCELESIDSDIPWLPEIQGWAMEDYHRCIDLYKESGVDLRSFPAVGVGSICRRQGTKEAQHIVTSIADRGIKVHGFGVKTDGLARNHRSFISADSFAWSRGGRYGGLCPHGQTKWEANCPIQLMNWREKVLDGIAQANTQPTLIESFYEEP